MARTNYTYEKRQRELAKKRKKEEKRMKKLGDKEGETAEGEGVETEAVEGAAETTVTEGADARKDDAAAGASVEDK